jgi:hypothetical protein
MKISVFVSLLVIALPTTAFAQRPSVYPLRSQDAATQGIDNAYCYWQARKQTGVDMARQSQRPERAAPLRFAADAGKGASEPPLPAQQYGSTQPSKETTKASLSASERQRASVADGEPSALADSAGASAATRGSAEAPASIAGSSAAASGTAATLPPLPPPQPPMTSYWQAYGDCMQSRGYGVH